MKYFIGLIALALPTYLVRFSIGGVPFTLLEFLIYAVFAYGLANMGYCQWSRLKTKIWLPIGLLLLAAIISVAISPLKIAALGQLKAFFIDPVLVLWLIICYLDFKDTKWVSLGLIGSGLIVSIHVIIQKILGQVTFDGRVIGLFGYSPNYLALFLAPIAIIGIIYGLMVFSKNRFFSYFLWSSSILNIIAIMFSGSRGGLVALITGLAFYFIWKNWSTLLNNKFKKLSLLGLLLIVIFTAVYFFKPNFNLSPQNGGRTVTSNNIRWEIWRTSWELIKKEPFLGVGLANYQESFNKLTAKRVNFPEYITPYALTPHNIFLMFWLSTGLIGLLAFIWILILFYQIGFKYRRYQFSALLLSIMTVILVQGLVDTPYFKNDLSIIFWLVVGCMLLLIKEDKKMAE